MSKKDKLLHKLENSGNVFSWQELCSLLVALGYEKVEKSGSRVRFYHCDLDSLLLLHKPHPENEIKGGALRSVKNKLREDNFL